MKFESLLEKEDGMCNGVDPELLTATERLEEVAAILAAGFLRLQLKSERKTGASENFFLDNPPNQCPHVSETIEK